MKSKSISMQNLPSVISSISICTTDSNNYQQYEFGGKIQSKTNCWSWTKLESRNLQEWYNEKNLERDSRGTQHHPIIRVQKNIPLPLRVLNHRIFFLHFFDSIHMYAV